MCAYGLSAICTSRMYLDFLLTCGCPTFVEGHCSERLCFGAKWTQFFIAVPLQRSSSYSRLISLAVPYVDKERREGRGAPLQLRRAQLAALALLFFLFPFFTSRLRCASLAFLFYVPGEERGERAEAPLPLPIAQLAGSRCFSSFFPFLSFLFSFVGVVDMTQPPCS